MAYTKTTWNNLSNPPINADNLNKIEQGIYDNSLGIDKINPSGTATTTAEIEEGQINDVIGFKSLKLKGQTSQYTTTGYNLLNIYARHPAGYTETVSGVTFTYNDDGSVNAKGTATADIAYMLATDGQLGDDIFNGTNYLSGCTGGSSTTFFLQFWANTIGRFQNVTTEVATNKTAGVSWNIAIIIINGVTIDKTFYPMMSATSGKTFEKYSGGKASPNPDFPQDVNNVSGYNVIEISNVNKLPYAQSGSYAVSGMTHTSNGKGVYTLNGTATANSRYDWEIEPYTIKQGDYLYLGNTATNSTVTVALLENTSTQIMYTGPTQVNRIVSLNNYVGRKVTYIRTYTNAQTLNNFILKPMICTTTSVSDFVEHQGNNFEINLGKNLIEDETFVQGSYLDNTMTIRISCRNIKLKANTTYTISSTLNYSRFNISAVTSTSQFPIANDTYIIYNSGWKNANFTFTTGSDDVYMNIAVKKLPDGVLITPNDVAGIKFQIEKGAIATNYASFFPPIEICKIGTYQDYIFKKDGKWWKHKAIKKIILNGTENWSYQSQYLRFFIDLSNSVLTGARDSSKSNYFVYGNTESVNNTFFISTASRLLIRDESITSADNFKTWLSTHNTTLYYVLATPIEEEITYAPLLRQLDELYNSGLYDVTNISQDNSSEAFVLDIEACKNNINGIVEYIRR